jgi:hypothetical protein
MKPLRGVGWLCALGLWGAGAAPASAAWCNVFQVCCHSCGRSSVSAYAAYAAPDPCCNPCPQVCTTRYVQRCYYQPVTTYQTRTYYEPVTTYRTSYYYEPVTSYRYSCYYDPCTCSYKQVACPTTCYQLRSQCCPVQSWVQRCCSVPVTTYQQCSYYEPVTTCCTPPPCCPTSYAVPVVSEAPAVATPPPAGTVQPPPAGPAQPGVVEGRSTPAPAVRETPGTTPGGSNPVYDRYYPMPPASGSSLRQPPPRLPVTPPAPVPAQAPPSVKLDRIVAVPTPMLKGQVVRLDDNAPQAGARLMFVSAAQKGPQQSVTADSTGQFRVTLASGGWLVYVHGADGKPIFHSKIDLRDNETRQVTLVSR